LIATTFANPFIAVNTNVAKASPSISCAIIIKDQTGNVSIGGVEPHELIIGGTEANVFTLLITVGRPQIPF